MLAFNSRGIKRWLMYSLGNILTDFFISGINFLFAYWVLRATVLRQRKTFTVWFALFFISVAFSGIAKGLGSMYPPESSLENRVIEQLCYLILAISGLASWNLGARLVCAKKARKNIYRFAYTLFGGLCCYITLVESNFFVVLIHNSIGLIFLLFSLVIQFYRKWDKEIAFGVLGIFTTFLALIVRQLAVGVDDAIMGLDVFFNGLSLFSSIMVYMAAKLLVSNEYKYSIKAY